jgi:oxygen-dependent protoporphyrinogen oxidase
MTYFMSFRNGMQTLTQACADFIGEGSIRLGARVKVVEPRGKGYAVVLESGEAIEADHVMIGTASYETAHMIRNFAPDAVDQMAGIDWSSSANVSLAFRKKDVKVPLRGFGFIIPKIENRRINATTYSSIKWSHRAPDDSILLRVFVGGGNREDLVYSLDDDAMVTSVLKELDAIIGLQAEPQFARVYRWYKAMPKYTVGHLDRMAVLDRRIAEHPGLHLIGCSYKGIGIGGCVQESLIAAEKLLKA